MGFSLQISDFAWLMSCIGIKRRGKDCHGRGLSREEGMRKRKVKRNEKKRTTTQAQNHFWMLMKPNLYENVDVLL